MRQSDGPADLPGRTRAARLRLFGGGAAAGLAAGLAVALYRALIAEAEGLRARLASSALAPADYALWAAALAGITLVLAALCRWEPMAAGSGIPQVKGVLQGALRMRWTRVLLVQIFGGALAIGAGLSLGHAGPAVQIGAAAAEGASRLSARRRWEERCLMTGGAAAGLSAVFNAPLSGMLFALEALHHHVSAAVILPVMAASVSAACAVRLLFGPGTLFLFEGLPPLPLSHLPYVLLLGTVCGAAAAVFNRGLLGTRRFYGLPCFRRPALRIAFALACAGLMTFACPLLTGGGDRLINAVTAMPPPLPVLLLLLLGKTLFTFVSFGSGVPGGFFFPSLTVGALTGASAGSLFVGAGLLPPESMANCILLAMAAFFTGSVRAPITGAVLLLEMTGSFAHLMPLAAACAVSYVVSGALGGLPIYDALLRRRLGASSALPAPHPVTVTVESGSALEHRAASALPLPPHTVLAEILRDGASFVPAPEDLLRPGDEAVFLTQDGDDALAALAAARPAPGRTNCPPR